MGFPLEVLVDRIVEQHEERRPSSPETEEEELNSYLETITG